MQIKSHLYKSSLLKVSLSQTLRYSPDINLVFGKVYMDNNEFNDNNFHLHFLFSLNLNGNNINTKLTFFDTVPGDVKEKKKETTHFE